MPTNFKILLYPLGLAIRGFPFETDQDFLPGFHCQTVREGRTRQFFRTLVGVASDRQVPEDQRHRKLKTAFFQWGGIACGLSTRSQCISIRHLRGSFGQGSSHLEGARDFLTEERRGGHVRVFLHVGHDAFTGLDVGVDLTTPGKGEMRGHDIETQVRTLDRYGRIRGLAGSPYVIINEGLAWLDHFRAGALPLVRFCRGWARCLLLQLRDGFRIDGI